MDHPGPREELGRRGQELCKDRFAASRMVEHRERIYLSEDRMALLTEEVWEITQQYLDARRRGKWLLNTSNCFSYQRPCEFLPYCQSGFNPNVADNLYDITPPHEELTNADSDAPIF